MFSREGARQATKIQHQSSWGCCVSNRGVILSTKSQSITMNDFETIIIRKKNNSVALHPSFKRQLLNIRYQWNRTYHVNLAETKQNAQLKNSQHGLKLSQSYFWGCHHITGAPLMILMILTLLSFVGSPGVISIRNSSWSASCLRKQHSRLLGVINKRPLSEINKTALTRRRFSMSPIAERIVSKSLLGPEVSVWESKKNLILALTYIDG